MVLLSGRFLVGAATALAHGDDLCEGAPWPSLACLSRDPKCIARPRPGLAPKRRPTPLPPAPAKRPRGQSPTPATGGPGVEWRPRLPSSTNRAASVWDPAPVSGGPVAGEAHGAWPTIEQGQQSLILASPSLRSVILRVCLRQCGHSGQTSLCFPRTPSREPVNT